MATRTALLLVLAVSLATSGFVLSANANERKTPIITFDPPGAGTGAGQGTLGIDISPNGTITGYYADSATVFHGYVRARDGSFITFGAPGAGTGSRQGTFAFSINPAGAIAGYYFDASAVGHSFVRAPNGAITTFDAPGAGTGHGQGTFTAGTDGINPVGAISGASIDANSLFHGFVRAPNGAITTFDVPGAGTGPNQGTLPKASVYRGRLREITLTQAL